MHMNPVVKVVLLSCLSLGIAGCGGGGGNIGGGSTGPVISTLSFPLQSGMKEFVKQGFSTDFSVSGTCKGSARTSSSTPATATFRSTAALAVWNSVSMTFQNCAPTYQYISSTHYYDSNYDLLGIVDQTGNYGLYTGPQNIPASVKVGDTGLIGTIEFKDPTQTFLVGHDDISYTIEPDTANTAIVNIVDKSYDVNGTLLGTEQDRYRIKADGTMIMVSIDLQLANGSTTHLVLTALPDTVSPTVSMTSPASYSTTVPVYATVAATFSERVDPATVNATSFTLMNGTTPVSGSVTVSGATATFTPSTLLTPNTIYIAKITTNVRDLAGNALGSNRTWQFQTAAPDITPPSVTSTSPAPNATAVAVNSTISATFSEPIDPATITTAQFTLTDGTTTVSGTVAYSSATATFTPAASLANDTLYTATITTGIRDLSGNAMTANHSWSFRTFAPAKPTVISSSPVPYAYAVASGSAVTAIFSTPMDPATLTSSSFTLLEGATPVAGTVTYSGSAATFTPAVALVSNRVYTATITTAAKDMAGTAMAADYSWTFQTFSDGSTTGPVNPPPAGLWQPAAGATPATGNFVYLTGDAGDYIGQGQTYTYTPATAVISVSSTGGLLSVNINGNTWWYGNFKVMNTLTQLQPGFYPGLQRYPFHNPVFGGLDWSGSGRGCNTLKGWFAIDNVSYDINGTLAAIDLRFEQNCEGGTTALHGAVHWGP